MKSVYQAALDRLQNYEDLTTEIEQTYKVQVLWRDVGFCPICQREELVYFVLRDMAIQGYCSESKVFFDNEYTAHVNQA